MNLIDMDKYKSAYDYLEMCEIKGVEVPKEIYEALYELTYKKELVEVEHGHWVSIDADKRGFADEFECSMCKSYITLSYYDTDCDYEFCPYCGAKMEEEGKPDGKT